MVEDEGMLVRKLGPGDVRELVALLEDDRENNLFHLANLEQQGIACHDLRYYGAFREGTLLGDLMLFRGSAGVFCRDSAALDPFAEILRGEMAIAISGDRLQVEPLLRRLPSEMCIQMLHAIYAQVTEETLAPWPERGERLATPTDADLLADLYATNLLFTSVTREEHRRRIRAAFDSGSLITLIERGGMAVSAARASAMGHRMGMIGGVVTLPAFRGHGFAKACTGLLSREMLARGFTPHLTYDPDNAPASRAYQSLGYRQIGEWLLAGLAPFYRPGTSTGEGESTEP